jgi:glycosyltransferase involved in cell wall biosynthesis
MKEYELESYEIRLHTMSPGIIVLNRKFIPHSPWGPFIYGVVPYAFKVAEILSKDAKFCGFILYNRQESNTEPQLLESSVFDMQAIEVVFNFRMDCESLQSIFEFAAMNLFKTWQRTAITNGDIKKLLPIIYYQTNVLLPFCPTNLPIIVTHHAPFAEHVCSVLGEELACKAFGNGTGKLQHLKIKQAMGIHHMKAHSNISAIELSFIQSRYLMHKGLPKERIYHLFPPLEIPQDSKSNIVDIIPEEIMNFLDSSGNSLIICSAVARLDEFKNIELLIQATTHLLKNGYEIRILILGGISGTDQEREFLKSTIPPHLQKYFLFHPKIKRNFLLSLFAFLSQKGLFVCPSRYETCGFTPLESISQGLCTVVADSEDSVEVASIVPKNYRFQPSIDGLCTCICDYYTNRHKLASHYLSTSIAEKVTNKRFETDFKEFWNRLSLSSFSI